MSTDNIQVAIKVRPIIKREKEEKLQEQWLIQGNTIAPIDNELRKRSDSRFQFDHIFDSQCKNGKIFDVVVKHIVDAAVKGINGTVFAYGQTSSGKTYTMMGTPEEPGIIPLAVDYTFNNIVKTTGREFLLRVSYLEIYNEKVNDLLNKNGKDLKLHEDKNGQVCVECKEEVTICPEDVLKLMKTGDKIRRTGETNMNERSSRSHTIFRITIESREQSDPDGAVQVSQLNLVDLAGSERAHQTGATGERFREGTHINKSLSALALVIKQLSESQDYVNFRDCKLTRLLQTSLGGNAMTAIICAVTPAVIDETQCTLAFAARAKTIKNKPRVNEEMSDQALLKRYAKQLKNLTKELEKVKQENKHVEVQEMESKLLEKESKLQEKDRRINELLEERIEMLKTRILSSGSTVESNDFQARSKRRRTWGGGLGCEPLPTIKEIENSPIKKKQIKRRQSIIQNVNLMNESFETKFADFELDLIKSERERIGRLSDLTNPDNDDEPAFISYRRPRASVKFMDTVSIISNNDESNIEQTLNDSAKKSNSPGTPKEKLRERIQYLTSEFMTLQEFTTLEKQLIQEDLLHDKQLRIDALEFDIDKLNERLSEKDSELVNLRQKLEYLERVHEVPVVGNDNSAVQNIINSSILNLLDDFESSRKSESVGFQEKVGDPLQSKMDLLIIENGELRATVAELNKKVENGKANEQIFSSQLEKALSENAELKTKIESFIQEVTEKAEITVKLESAKFILQENLDKQNEVILEYQLNNERLKERISRLEKDQISFDTERNNLKKTISDLNERLKIIPSLESEVSKLTSDKIDYDQVIADLRKNLIDKSSTISEENLRKQNQVVLEHEATIENLGKQIQCLESEKIAWDIEKNNFLKQIEHLSDKLKMIPALENEVSKLISDKTDFEQIVADLRLKLNENVLTGRLEQALIENEELKSKIELTPEKSELEIHLKAENERLQEDLKNLNDSILKYQSTVEELQAKITSVENDKVSLNSQKDDLLKNVDLLNEKLQSIPGLESQIVELMSTKGQYEDEIADLKKDLDEKSSLLSKLDEALTENADLKSKLDASKSEIPKKSEAEIQLELENGKLQEDLKKLNDAILEQQSIIEQLKDQITSLENDKVSLNTEKQDLLKNLELLNEKLQTISNLESKISELTSGNIQHEEIIAGLKKDLDEKSSLVNKLEEALSENAEAKSTADTSQSVPVPVPEKSDIAIQVDIENKKLQNNSMKLNESILVQQSTIEKPGDSDELSDNDKKSNSIYANGNDLEILATDDSVFVPNASLFEDVTKSSDIPTLRRRIKDLEEYQKRLEIAYKELADKIVEIMPEESSKLLQDLIDAKLQLEEENSRLVTDLQLKIRETEEVKTDISSLKLDMESLEKAIRLLTSENTDMTEKLAIERDRSKQSEVYFEKLVDELYSRISTISEEKTALESQVFILNKEIERLELASPVNLPDQLVEEKMRNFRNKIESLTNENIELSSNLMDTIKELDKLKESKTLLYDHECIFKERLEAQTEKCQSLEAENIEMSNNVMEKIEEYDELYEKYQVLQKKLESLQCNEKNQSSEDTNSLSVDNQNLRAEIIELRSTIVKLTEENSQVSKSLLEKVDDLDKNRSLDLSTDQSETSQVKILMEENSHLTRLNKRLSELKFSSCPQCVYLRELNDSRRNLKIELEAENHRLRDLQKKFEKKCADIEILRNKANEDLNSSICNVSLNESVFGNVSVVEEKVQLLSNELEVLKEDHDKISNLYKEKCSELEKLQDKEKSKSALQENKPERSRKDKKKRIETIEEQLDRVKEDISRLKAQNSSISSTVHKYMNEKQALQNEISSLRQSNEESEQKSTLANIEAAKAVEKVRLLELEVKSLNKELDDLTSVERQLKADKIHLEVEVESLKADKEAKQIYIAELEENVTKLNENKEVLSKLIEELSKEKENLLEKQESMQLEHEEKLQTCVKEFKENMNGSEKKISEINKSLSKHIEENEKLKQELLKFQENVSATHSLETERRKLDEELGKAKENIVKEIQSLKSNVRSQDTEGKSVCELVRIFMETIMLKEKEIMKTLEMKFEKDKRQLIDEKRQSDDAEKRASSWAKELEGEIEKLQNDLTHQENKNRQILSQLRELENLLKENEHENKILKEKIEVLEMDFTTLQAELEEKSKVNVGETLVAVQEKEKFIEELMRNKEDEFKKKEKEYQSKLDEINRNLESYKTKNMELKSNLEGLEANEKQLRNIVDLKNIENAKHRQRLQEVEIEMSQLNGQYRQVLEENNEKTRKITEITDVLKSKCDLLSEYKTKSEILIPEYEKLKEQMMERKQTIEKCKAEIESLQAKNEKQEMIFKDRLNVEEIKSNGLQNQIEELNNRNASQLEELKTLREKYEDLENENIKLERKLRNSTSKSRAETEMEELKDINRSLQSKLEGMGNRVTELQESRNRLMKDFVELRGKYQLVCQENDDLRRKLANPRLNDSNVLELREKYDRLLYEKNQIALELENKKLCLNTSVNEKAALEKKIEELIIQNKNLDEEMDDMNREIENLRQENGELGKELCEYDKNPLHQQVSKLTEENEKLQSAFKEKIFTSEKQIQDLENSNKVLVEKTKEMERYYEIVKRENSELKIKLSDLENRGEVKSSSRDSSRSNSPALEINKQRRQRRSDLFNQNRQLEDMIEMPVEEKLECQCSLLKQQIRDLELQLVSKNGKIATLEIQIQSENFPFQTRCKDLEENLLAYKNKNAELRHEIKRLQRALIDTTSRGCDVCRKRQLNKQDQATQYVEPKKVFLSGMSGSGVIAEHMKMEKLEKQHEFMKQVCRARNTRIKELEFHIKKIKTVCAEHGIPMQELDNIETPSTSTSSNPSTVGHHSREPMKENVPYNVTPSSIRGRYVWNY